MKKTKFTQWFHGFDTPVHVGVYQRLGFGYSFWDGGFWHTADSTPRKAARQGARSGFQSEQWRGLANKP